MIRLLNKPEGAVWEKPSWRLPWGVMATALLVYLLGLPHPANFSNAELAARVCGWDWQTNLKQPLISLFLLPCQLLPLGWRVAALNVVNAFLAAISLGLVVRIMQLWPRDRTPDLRTWQPERLGPLTAAGLAWAGPVAAAIALGLTLNFWEQATAFTGDMINLLILATTGWWLLEFWHDRQIHWLFFTGIVYGLGLANDWVLVALLPGLLFIIAGLHGWQALLEDFALTLATFAAGQKRPDWRAYWMLLLGLELCPLWLLVLPALHWSLADDHTSFWLCVKPVLHWYKTGLKSEWGLLLADGRGLTLAVSSLLPLFLITLRWQDESPSVHAFSYRLTNHLYWILHLFLTGLSGWILLGGVIGPAHLIQGQSFLPYYLCCALVFGYGLNYLIRRLLGQFVPFRADAWQGWRRALSGVWLGLLLVLVATESGQLICRNGPIIWLDNRTLPDLFGRWLQTGLPAGPKVVIADDPRLLYLARLLLLDTPVGADTRYWDTTAASWVDYHRHQASLYPANWRKRLAQANEQQRVRIAVQQQLLKQVAAARPIFALQPCAVSIYDDYQVRLQGQFFALVPRPTNGPPLDLPALTVAAGPSPMAREMALILPQLTNAVGDIATVQKFDSGNKLIRLFELPPAQNPAAVFFACYFASLLDAEGVELETGGHWNEADQDFQAALALNSLNLCARVNHDYNQRHQSGLVNQNSATNNQPLDFDIYHSLPQALRVCGPVDDPLYLMSLGDECSKAEMVHQALDHFHRVLQLEPGNWGAQLWFASLSLKTGQPAEALSIISQVRQLLTDNGWLPQFDLNLQVLAGQANLALKKRPEALAAFQQAIQLGNGNAKLMAEVVEILWRSGYKPEVMSLLNDLARQHPEEASVFILRGLAHEHLDEADAAQEDFGRALVLNPKDDLVHYWRGCLLVKLNRFGPAQQEFQSMLDVSTNAFPAYYALAQVAAAQTNNALARQELQNYLAQAPTNAPDFDNAEDQLKTLK